MRKSRPQCTVAGCDRPNYGRGLCEMHYTRDRRTGRLDLHGTAPGEARDFFENVVKSYAEDACLIWPYSTKGPDYKKGKGYPQSLKFRRATESLNGVPSFDKCSLE